MKKMIVLIVLLLPVLLYAQNNPPVKSPYVAKGKTSLFDPSKLSIHQSYTFGYFSGGGTSGSLGYYLNSIEYNISNPLKIRVDLGFLHSPSSMISGRSSLNNSGVFVPGVSVDWKPSPYFNFRLDYHHVPAYNNNGMFFFDPTYGEGNH